MKGGEGQSRSARIPAEFGAALFASARDSGSLAPVAAPELAGGCFELRERLPGDRTGERWLGVEAGSGESVEVTWLHAPLAAFDPETLDGILGELAAAPPGAGVACTQRSSARAGEVERLALVSSGASARRLADPECAQVSPRTAIQGCARVARQVHTLHERGIVHGSLSPLSIARAGQGEWIVMDLGVAAILTGGGAEGRRCLLREPEFLAPELLAGEPAGPATDIFGLGATLYWGVAGRRVHPLADDAAHEEELEDAEHVTLEELPTLAAAARSPRHLLRALSWLDVDLEQICGDALALDPDARPGSAAELADSLERYLAGRDAAPDARLVVRAGGATRVVPLTGTRLAAGLDPAADLHLPGAADLAFELVDTGFGWCAIPRERPIIVEEVRHGTPVLLRHLSAFECGGASCTFVQGG